MNEKVPDTVWMIGEWPNVVFACRKGELGETEYHRALSPAEVEAKARRAARVILNAPLEDSAPDDCGCSDHQRIREIAAIIAAEFGAAAEIRPGSRGGKC